MSRTSISHRRTWRGRQAALLFAISLVAASASRALADPTPMITPPAGWRLDAEQSAAVTQRLRTAGQIGHSGPDENIAAEIYVPAKLGIALIASRSTSFLRPGQAVGGVARAALDGLRLGPERAGLAGGNAASISWHEQADAAAKLFTATLAWKDPTSHLRFVGRIVIASDDRKLVSATAECVDGDVADPALISACQAAFATLDTGIAPADRIAIEPAPASTATSASGDSAEASAALSAPSMSESSGSEPPLLDDGRHVALPPMAISSAPPPIDRRPIYAGAFIVVMAAGFWWNRRRRDRFEREDQLADASASAGRAARTSAGPAAPAAPASPRTRPSRSSRRDPDADDLHAAARGDAPDEPDAPDQRARPAPRQP